MPKWDLLFVVQLQPTISLLLIQNSFFWLPSKKTYESAIQITLTQVLLLISQLTINSIL
jgi:hypothetical protein